VSPFVRDDHRYHCSVAVRLRCDSWEDYLALHATNLSATGVFILSEEVVARIGADVSVEVELPGGETISLAARVIHHNGEAPGMGLRFSESQPGTRAKLKVLLALARRAAELPTDPAPINLNRKAPADPLEQRLLDELGTFDELEPHQQLGVAPGASAAEIEAAYQRQLQKYSAGAFEPCGDEARLLVGALRELVEIAHAQLTAK
jgi:PilZ domain